MLSDLFRSQDVMVLNTDYSQPWSFIIIIIVVVVDYVVAMKAADLGMDPKRRPSITHKA